MKKSVDALVRLPYDIPIPKLVLGNKTELLLFSENGYEKHQPFDDSGFDAFFNISVKLNIAVHVVVGALVRRIMNNHDIIAKISQDKNVVLQNCVVSTSVLFT